MRPRLKKLLVTLGIVIGLIIVFLLANENSPLPYYFAHPTNYAECVKAHGTKLDEKGINSCIFHDKLFIDRTIKSEDKLKTYADREFSVKYSELLRELDTNVAIHFLDNNRYDGIALVHSINVKHCDLSGRPEGCTPETTDLNISLVSVDKKYADVVAAATKANLGELKEEKIGENVTKTYTEGAEGEGKSYYLYELPNNRTLIITSSYIDEQVVGQYKEAKDFIKYADQKAITQQVLKSLKINR